MTSIRLDKTQSLESVTTNSTSSFCYTANGPEKDKCRTCETLVEKVTIMEKNINEIKELLNNLVGEKESKSKKNFFDTQFISICDLKL
uniref:Uncharacterized protein n=1 Tax=Strongyloides venezuelensis TaxID=75913 RepID=A0A0K0FFK9_STRVS